MSIQAKSISKSKQTLLPRIGKSSNVIRARIRRQSINLIRARCNKQMKRFDALLSLEQETKKQIRSKIKRSYIETIGFSGSIIAKFSIAQATFLASLIFVNSFLEIYIFSSLYHIPESVNLLTAFIASLFCFCLLPLLVILMKKSRNLLYVFVILFGIPLLLIFVLYKIIESEYLLFPVNELKSTILLLFTSLILSSFEIIFVNITIIVTIFLVDNREKNEYPVTYIIEMLVSILADAEKNRYKIVKLSHKRRQLLRLETVAKQIEYYMPKQLRGGDFITDTWTRETFRQIATSVRNKKKWIITPKSDSNNYFIKSIADILLSVVNDDWDSLDHMESEHLSRPQFRHLVLRIMRTVLIAIIPLTALIIFQLTPFALKGTAFQYIVIGAYIWIVLVLIVALDPTINAKIETFKNISSIFPPK